MANKNVESSSQPPPVQPQQQQQQQSQQQPPAHEQDQDHNHGNADARSRAGNTVFKSGPLSISSKGLGWTTWKKRWFILTRTSLVFFRSDPSAVQQKGSEVNLTLGGIDLNNSGSVVVKADKKLLTVLFPDGRDGRAFTLKADTNEDLYEWKSALENALTQAPSASHVMGQNGIFRNEHSDTPTDVDVKKDETPSKSTVLGRPVLLALEDVDGSPSFLEKALRFVEDHGSKTEGILRQAADVEDVEFRIREYEQGRHEFTPGEDAHVIADCLKYFLRELPSSPVPASCCNALLDACRTDRGNRVNAMRAAICETFPEPNRRLLQRILMMMQVVASNKNVNRMNTNAVAACMAPLLLRPLLAGDCEIENDFDVGGDGSMQLLQAAAAANHAQAIVITLLEEYHTIFGEGSLSPGLYSDSEESGSGTEEGTDDEEYDDDDDDDDDGSQGSDDYTDEEEYIENESNGSYSDSAASGDYHGDDIDLDDPKINGNLSSESRSTEGSREPKVTKTFSSSSKRSSLKRRDNAKGDENILVRARGADNTEVKSVVEVSKIEDKKSSASDPASTIQKPSKLSSASGGNKSNRGRTGGNKSVSVESIDSAEVDEDDDDIKRLESTKLDLQNRTAEEVKNNAALQANLEQKKKALYARRQALEEDVERLQEELQKEKDRKSALEAGLNMSKGKKLIPETIDEKLKKDIQDVAQAEADIAKLEDKVDDLENRLGKDCRKITDHNARENDSRNKSSQQEMSRGGSSKAAVMSKKSGPKGEGNTTTTIAALSKLTMRLNFLKERRSQIANELSNMDKGILSPGISNPSSRENRGSESLQEAEKGSGSNQNQSQNNNNNKNQNQSQNNNKNQIQTKDKNQNQNQSQTKDKNQDKNQNQNQSQNKNKNQSQTKNKTQGQNKNQNQDKNQDKNQNQNTEKSKIQNPHVLDRGRSENGGDRGRESGGDRGRESGGDRGRDSGGERGRDSGGDRGRESGESHPNTTQRTFSR